MRPLVPRRRSKFPGARVSPSTAVAVDGVFDDVALLTLKIHEERLYGQIVGLRATRPATYISRAFDLLLRRNHDDSVLDRQRLRRVRRGNFAVYEAHSSAGVVKVKFGIDGLVALH